MKFDQRADSYEAFAKAQRIGVDSLKEWIDPSVSGEAGLEFGAGTGLLTRYLEPLPFGTFMATDFSENMVSAGRVNCPSVQWSKVDAWNPEGALADRVYSSSLLQWAPDSDSVLKAWRRMSRKSGRLLAGWFVDGSLDELGAWDDRLVALEWRDERTWIDSLECAAWKPIRSETMEISLRYDSALDALKSLHMTGAVSRESIPPSELRSLLKQIDNGYLSVGYVPLTWRYMKIEAEAV